MSRSGAGARRLTAKLYVTIEAVTTEDEGEVVLSYRQPHVSIDVHATASDPDGGMIITRWLWERSDVVTASARSEDVVDGWTPHKRCIVGCLHPEAG